MLVIKCGPDTKPAKTFELQLKSSDGNAGIPTGVVVLTCRVNGTENWLLKITEKDGKLYFDRYTGTDLSHYDQAFGVSGKINVT